MAGADASVGVDTAREYDGSYSGACTAVSDAVSSEGWVIEQYEFNGNAVAMSVDYFSDAGCTQAGEQQSVTIDVLLRYPGGQVLTPLGNADFVNVTPLEISLDGLVVATEVERLMAEEGLSDTFFDLLLLDGDTLYFGDATVAIYAGAP